MPLRLAPLGLLLLVGDSNLKSRVAAAIIQAGPPRAISSRTDDTNPSSHISHGARGKSGPVTVPVSPPAGPSLRQALVLVQFYPCG